MKDGQKTTNQDYCKIIITTKITLSLKVWLTGIVSYFYDSVAF
jgi:hypothetical protein